MGQIAHYRLGYELLMPSGCGRVTRQRVQRFIDWLQASGRSLYLPDLAAWRDALLAEGIAPVSVAAYLGTVRARYAELLRDDAMRNGLYEYARTHLAEIEQADTVANRYAVVSELMTRLHNGIDPARSRVKAPVQQDHIDEKHLRLSPGQCETLLNAPGLDTLKGVRDTGIIAVFLCSGVRVAELAAVQVADLRHTVAGEIGLYVRHGKGGKSRFVPWGDLAWCLAIVETWLDAAHIGQGPVFRWLHSGGDVHTAGLTTGGVMWILEQYKIEIGGRDRVVRPHDLRRTYAARQYAAGMDLNALRQNLGHSDVKTTLGYIGAMDIETRRGQAVFSFDMSRLAAVNDASV